MKVTVIGGGAAGLMAAISVVEHYPEATVLILEKSGKFLSKVKISGGGRCNVMHTPLPSSQLLKAYPRGKQILKKTLPFFSPENVMEWFEAQGVKLKTEADGRVFPVTDSSQTIMDCLLNTARSAGVTLLKKFPVNRLEKNQDGSWAIHGNEQVIQSDKVIIATGGSPKRSGMDWLESLGHSIVEPVPSLFTFNIPDGGLAELKGISVPSVKVRIQGTKLEEEGPMLITHWGISGPAVIRLSAFAAIELHEKEYRFDVVVNWLNEDNQAKVVEMLSALFAQHPNRKVANNNVEGIPQRVWHYLLDKAQIQHDKPNNEVGLKRLNRLTEVVCNDIYHVNGRTVFKDEFVTCGGVAEASVKLPSLESASCSGIYFCGEVLNMDGITGGFNFQAAWTTGYVAGMLMEN